MTYLLILNTAATLLLIVCVIILYALMLLGKEIAIPIVVLGIGAIFIRLACDLVGASLVNWWYRD